MFLNWLRSIVGLMPTNYHPRQREFKPVNKDWSGEYFSAKMSDLALEYKEADRLMDLNAGESSAQMMMVLSKIAGENGYKIAFITRFKFDGPLICVFKRFDNFL